jgi:methyl-accepting chemotaxis protein
MFRNMKVGLRLALGFTVVLVLMIAIIGVSLRSAQENHDQLERIVKINNVRIHLANNMVDGARETAIVVRNILLATHNIDNSLIESTQKSKDQLTEIWREYNESFVALGYLSSKDDAKGLELFRKVETSATTARQLQDQVVELAEAGNRKEAIDFMTGTASPSRTTMDQRYGRSCPAQ